MLRGEVYELSAPRRARGHEQKGKRYGVVLQASELAPLSTVVIAPTSMSARGASFRPVVVIRRTKTKVLVEQLGAVDASRLGKRVKLLAVDELAEIDQALRIVLSL